MTADLDAWLAQTPEEPLDPDLPICDPHHHLWDREGNRYLLGELRDDTAGHNVVSTVFVECMSMYRSSGPEEMKPVGETEFVEGIAAESVSGRAGGKAVIAGIVSFADLALGKVVEPILEAHGAASPGRFKGIRHNCGWDASPEIRNSHTNPPEGLYSIAKFREGFACLESRNLSFDSFLYHPQLTELLDLARAFTGVTIILNHFGGPLGIGRFEGKREEVFEDWKKAIGELATCPNVVVKIGGLAMPINGFGWHKREKPPTSEELAEATAPYYLYCIEKFGPARCMFESNFPVDKRSCSYTVLWNSFKRIAEGFSADEKADLFHDTAARVYRLVEE